MLLLASLALGPSTATAATGTLEVNIMSQSCRYIAHKSNRVEATVNYNRPCVNHRAKLQYVSAAGTFYTTEWTYGQASASWKIPAGTTYANGWTGAALVVMGTTVWKDQRI